MSTSIDAVVPLAPRAASVVTIRTVGLAGLLFAKMLGGWGLGWDIRWHLLIGRDSFSIPPHVLTYLGVALGAALSLGILAYETWSSPDAPGTVRVAGLRGTRGFHLAWWGMALTILAAPLDDLWHRLFGIDVTLWSPPHLLGLAGAQVNTLGCLLIALELGRLDGRSHAAALLLGGTLLLGVFHIVVDPAIQTAFRRGGALFFTWPVLAALAFAFTCVLTAIISRWRSAPLILVVGAVLFQLSIFGVADLGFALTAPTSHIAEAIASDPTSPIAISHEMARRNGSIPGRSLTLRLLPILPAALMVLIDARRRWAMAAVVFGAALMGSAAIGLGRLPALAHALPDVRAALLALPLVLGAAVTGAWTAVRLARIMAPVRARTRAHIRAPSRPTGDKADGRSVPASHR
jgi:hypothetical protein